MKRKQGISLIVLVITIIVMIILAASVVISLNNTGIINKANTAVQLTDEKQVQDLASLIWAECYLDPARKENIENEVKTELEKQGITADKWNITVTETGVSVTSKTVETKPDFSYLTKIEGCSINFGRAYINEELNVAILAFVDGAALVGWPGYGWRTDNVDFYPNGTLIYNNNKVVIDDNIIAECSEDGNKIYYNGYEFVFEPVSLGTNEYCSHTIMRSEALQYVSTYIMGQTEKYTGNTHCVYCDEIVKEGICNHITTQLQNVIYATCNVDGYTGDVICLDCGEKISNGSLIKAEHIDNNKDNKCDKCDCDYYEKGTLVFEIDNIAYYYGENNEVLKTYVGWINETYSSSKRPPWYENRNEIYKVLIKEGIEIYSLDSWFTNCINLISVSLPEGIKILGNYSFSKCENLVEIHIPSSVSATGQYAFSGCKALKNIIFGDNSNLYGIGDSAFQYCTNLTDIVIPGSLRQINSYAFYGCTSLANIKFDGSVEDWNAIKKYTAWNFNVPATNVDCIGGNVEIN